MHNRKIIDTKHAIDRAVERYSNISKDRIIKVVNDAIDKIINDYHDESTTYGVWSKSTGICVILNWRRQGDKKYDDGKNHAVIITLPPIKKNFNDFHTTGKKDVRFMVERLLESYVPWYLKRGRIREVKIEDHSLFFERGKMFDSGIAYCLEVI